MTQHAQDFETGNHRDLLVLAFYSYAYSGPAGLHGILIRMTDDERDKLRHIAASFYKALADEGASS